MRGPRKVHMVFARAVAFQTALVDFFCGCSLEAENLFQIAWIVHMSGGRPVASFASLFGWTATVVERGFPMWRSVKVVEDILVTGLACFRAGIACRGGRLFLVRSGCRCSRLPRAIRLLRVHRPSEKGKK